MNADETPGFELVGWHDAGAHGFVWVPTGGDIERRSRWFATRAQARDNAMEELHGIYRCENITAARLAVALTRFTNSLTPVQALLLYDRIKNHEGETITAKRLRRLVRYYRTQ